MKELPKVSVITVVYNDVTNIEMCIRNTLLQTYRNLELIVVDGGSTDGTADVIKKYDLYIKWVSEEDRGLYDAMNKGVTLATGEWVLFRNCGDFFYDEYVIEKVFSNYEDKGESFIIGNERYFRHWGYKDVKPKILVQNYMKSMPVNHPATFIRRKVQYNNPFNLTYRNSADYDFFIRTFKQGATYKYFDDLFSIFDANEGATAEHFDRTLKENIQLLTVHGAPQEYIDDFCRHLEQIRIQYSRSKNPLYKRLRAFCSYFRQGWTLTLYDACISKIKQRNAIGEICR